MPDFDHLEEDQGGTVFRDVLMLTLLGFMVIVVILLPYVNPPTQAADLEPPGNVIVEVRWPDGMDADVDLWVQGPGGRPVGYSNQSGPLFNLLRDDLGSRNDSTALNYEIAYSRGIVQGDYTVNLHLYRYRTPDVWPVPATVVVKLKRGGSSTASELVTRQVLLRRIGEEATAARFSLDDKGRLVPGSLHDMPRPLRNAG